jgi:ankyrin repeat protein
MTLGEYTGELKEKSYPFSSYTIIIPNDETRVIDGEKTGNFTRFINCSQNANVAFYEYKKTSVIVKAIKKIYPGEQLLIQYGYDEEERDYFCLNPDDPNESIQSYYHKNKSIYECISVSEAIGVLGLSEGDYLAVPKVFLPLLKKKSWAAQSKIKPYVNHRLFKLNENKVPYGLTEYNFFTPLMLACCLGNVEKVLFLLKMDASPFIQQTLSGDHALLLTLKAYAHAKQKNTAASCKAYMEIILLLIKENSEVMSIHNKREHTLIHLAVKYLEIDDFKMLWDHLLAIKIDFNELLSQIDKNNNDIFMLAIKHKRFHLLPLLLTQYPRYFSENINIEPYSMQEEEKKYYQQNMTLFKQGQTLPPFEREDKEEKEGDNKNYYTLGEFNNVLSEYGDNEEDILELTRIILVYSEDTPRKLILSLYSLIYSVFGVCDEEYDFQVAPYINPLEKIYAEKANKQIEKMIAIWEKLFANLKKIKCQFFTAIPSDSIFKKYFILSQLETYITIARNMNFEVESLSRIHDLLRRNDSADVILDLQADIIDPLWNFHFYHVTCDNKESSYKKQIYKKVEQLVSSLTMDECKALLNNNRINSSEYYNKVFNLLSSTSESSHYHKVQQQLVRTALEKKLEYTFSNLNQVSYFKIGKLLHAQDFLRLSQVSKQVNTLFKEQHKHQVALEATKKQYRALMKK